MKAPHILFLLLYVLPIIGFAESTKNVARVVDLKSGDGTILKERTLPQRSQAPGVLLFHQSNRTRESWEVWPANWQRLA